MGSGTAKYEKKDHVAVVTLDRPEKLNALDDALFHGIDAALRASELDDDVRVVVFRGSGRAFSVGMDLSGEGAQETGSPDWRQRPFLTTFVEAAHRAQARWEYLSSFPKFTVAAVHGYALNEGLYLAMCCDFIMSTNDARLGVPAVRAGHVTPLPLWARSIGMKKAKELVLSGKSIDGEEAASIGLILRAVSAGSLDRETANLAQQLAAVKPELAVRVKQAFQSGLNLRGLGGAWRYCADLHMFGLVQPVMPGEFDFFEARDQEGLKAAFEKLHSPFKNRPGP